MHACGLESWLIPHIYIRQCAGMGCILCTWEQPVPLGMGMGIYLDTGKNYSTVMSGYLLLNTLVHSNNPGSVSIQTSQYRSIWCLCTHTWNQWVWVVHTWVWKERKHKSAVIHTFWKDRAYTRYDRAQPCSRRSHDPTWNCMSWSDTWCWQQAWQAAWGSWWSGWS